MTAKEREEMKEQKAFERVVSKIHKILQDKNVKSVNTVNGYTVITFKNGQVFKMKGKAVTEVGAGKYASMLKDATKTIADCGELPIKDEAPE